MHNILIADDHSIVRAGLKLLINSCIRDVAIDEAEDGETVIRKMKSASFDLLILDINMPHTESFSLTTYLLKEYTTLKIIIFTMNQEVFFAKRFSQDRRAWIPEQIFKGVGDQICHSESTGGKEIYQRQPGRDPVGRTDQKIKGQSLRRPV